MATNYPQQTTTTNLGLSLIGQDEAIAEDFIIIDNAFGSGGKVPVLQTNGVPNTLQSVHNLIAGVNITLTTDAFGGVTLSSTGSGGSGLNIPTAGFLSPLPAFSPTESPSTINSAIYTQDINGNWHAQAGIDPTKINLSHSVDPVGTLTWTRKQYFRDSRTPKQLGEAFLSVNHVAGVGTTSTNQDRAQWIFMSNLTGLVTSSAIAASIITLGVSGPVDGYGNAVNWFPGQVLIARGLTNGAALNNRTFTVLTASASTITAIAQYVTTFFSITSNVLHFEITNSLQPGDSVTFSGFTTATYLNGQTVTITSASVSQFFAPFTHADTGGNVNDAGLVTLNLSPLGSAADSGTLDQQMYSMEGIQSEVDIVGTPGPVGYGFPDGEIMAGSFQLADEHVGQAFGPNFGVGCIRASLFRSSGNWSGGTGFPFCAIHARTQNDSTDSGVNNQLTGVLVRTQNDQTAALLSSAGVDIERSSNRYSSNYGLIINGFRTDIADFAIITDGGQCFLNGPVGMASAFATAGSVAMSGGFSATGLRSVQLAAPTAIFVTAAVPAGTTYTYAVVAYDVNGIGVASATTTITNGPTTLSVINYIQLEIATLPPIGVSSYAYYRTVGGLTQGKIATVIPSANDYQNVNGGATILHDTGLVADGSSLPAGNMTGSIMCSGPIIESTTLSPTSGGTAGVTGQFAWDSGFIYVCTVGGAAGAATWKKSALVAA